MHFLELSSSVRREGNHSLRGVSLLLVALALGCAPDGQIAKAEGKGGPTGGAAGNTGTAGLGGSAVGVGGTGGNAGAGLGGFAGASGATGGSAVGVGGTGGNAGTGLGGTAGASGGTSGSGPVSPCDVGGIVATNVGPLSVALDADYAYVSFSLGNGTGGVSRVAKYSLGVLEPLVTTASTVMALAVTDAGVFYATEGISRVAKLGGAPTPVFVPSSTMVLAVNTEILVDGNDVYFLAFAPPIQPGTTMLLAHTTIDGGPVDVLATAPSIATLAASPDDVFFVERGTFNGGADRVRRVPRTGGAASDLATGLLNAGGVTFFDGTAYVAVAGLFGVDAPIGPGFVLTIAADGSTSKLGEGPSPGALQVDAERIYYLTAGPMLASLGWVPRTSGPTTTITKNASFAYAAPRFAVDAHSAYFIDQAQQSLLRVPTSQIAN